MRLATDSRERVLAGRIMEVFPHWLVLWGTHSREFWAYPCFGPPARTVLHATDPGTLTGMMRQWQRAVQEGAYR